MQGSREEYILYSRLPAFQKLVNTAKLLIAEALKTTNKPYLALSGGKDSTVVLDLIQQIKPDIECVWSDDEWWLPETKEYFDRLRAKEINVRQIQSKAWHTNFFTAHEKDGVDFDKWINEQGYDMVFLGLRAEESNARRITLRKSGLMYQTKSRMWHVNPIGWWTVRDVWAYIYSRNIDYNKAYDKLEQMGIPREEQRIGPLAVERVLGFGQIAILKRGWPNLYNRFAKAYPEVKNYT